MIVIKSSLPSSGYTQKYKEAFTMYCQNKNYLISLKNTELHTTSKSFLNLPNPMPLTDHISLISLPVVVSSCISCTQFSSVVVVHTLLLRLVFINTQVLIITITTITVATNQVPNNLKIIIHCCLLSLKNVPVWLLCPLVHIFFTSIMINVVHVLMVSKHEILKPHVFLFDLSSKANLTAASIRGTATCFTSKHKHGTVFDGVILHGTNNTSQGFLVLVKRVQGGGCCCVRVIT